MGGGPYSLRRVWAGSTEGVDDCLRFLRSVSCGLVSGGEGMESARRGAVWRTRG